MPRISPFSRKYLRKRAEDKMEDACQIWHPQAHSLNFTSNVASFVKGTPLYDGPCRIWQTSPGDHVLLGDEQITSTTTYLSLPHNAYTPRHDDVVLVTKALDTQMIGQYFQVISSSLSGGLRASRRFTVSVFKSASKDTW